MPQSPQLTWILFDAVGTLIQPVPSVAEAYWEIGQRFGSRLSVLEVGERFQREFSNSYSHDDSDDLASNEQIERERWQQIVERVLDDVGDREQCFAAVHRHFSQASAWKLFNDVPEILSRLRQSGYNLAIASNFDERLSEVTRGHEVLRAFDAVLTSAELGFRKPSHHFYVELGRRLQAAPDEMLMVGDHPINDVEAARAAGLRAVLIDREDRHADQRGRMTSLDRLTEWI